MSLRGIDRAPELVHAMQTVLRDKFAGSLI